MKLLLISILLSFYIFPQKGWRHPDKRVFEKYLNITCDYYTNTLAFDKYDLKELAKLKKLNLCVNNDLFDKYDLQEMGRLNFNIAILANRTKLDLYEIEALSFSGVKILVNQISNYDIYDLKRLRRSRVRVRLQVHETSFDMYDLKNLILTGVEFKVIRHKVKLDDYDIRQLLQRKTEVIIIAHELKYDRYDLVKFLKYGAKVYIDTNKIEFDNYDLKKLALAGAKIQAK